jgi:inner membrane protein involved in colicin E2 resistance
MAHRLAHIPMQPVSYQEERDYILKIGPLNGCNETFVKQIIEKHERKKREISCSTMFMTSEHKKVFSRTISIPYHPKLSKNICKNFEQHDIRMIKSSNMYKLKNRLQSTKMPIPENEKFCVYEITCKT